MGGRMKEIENAWVNVLSAVYSAVDWSRMSGSKSRYDVFAHRVEFSANKRTVGEFLQRLGNCLGIQALPGYLDEDSLKVLREDEKESMRYLRKNTKLLIFLAVSGRKNGKKSKEEKIASLEEFGGV